MRFCISICIAFVFSFTHAATTAFPDAVADVDDFTPPAGRRATVAEFSGNDVLTERQEFIINSFSLLTGSVEFLQRGEFIESETCNTRQEWIRQVVAELVHPDTGLFEFGEENPDFLYIRRVDMRTFNRVKSHAYLAVGRLMAYSLMHNVPLNMYFPTSFYGQFLGRTLSLNDIREEEPELARSLQYILSIENEAELEGMALDIDGVYYDLFVPNRTAIIEAKINSLVPSNRLPAIEMMRQGFADLSPTDGLQLLDIQARIAGSNAIDAKRFLQFIKPSGIELSRYDMFRSVIRSLSDEQRMELFKIITGYSRVPFAPIERITITARDSIGGLPMIRVCSRSFDLPRYENEAAMRSAILDFLHYINAIHQL